MAQHFGGEATVTQCKKRYYSVLQHLEQGLVRNQKWSEAEVNNITQLGLDFTFILCVSLKYRYLC